MNREPDGKHRTIGAPGTAQRYLGWWSSAAFLLFPSFLMVTFIVGGLRPAPGGGPWTERAGFFIKRGLFVTALTGFGLYLWTRRRERRTARNAWLPALCFLPLAAGAISSPPLLLWEMRSVGPFVADAGPIWVGLATAGALLEFHRIGWERLTETSIRRIVVGWSALFGVLWAVQYVVFGLPPSTASEFAPAILFLGVGGALFASFVALNVFLAVSFPLVVVGYRSYRDRPQADTEPLAFGPVEGTSVD